MSEMLMEAIAQSSQMILDAVESKQSWNPEANRYSRCFNPTVLMPLIATHLQGAEIFLLFTFIDQMNAENKVGSKMLKQLNMNRTTLWRAKQKLESKYCVYEFEDGSIMINPNIAVLSKYRKHCLHLQSVWKTATKQVIQPEQENEKELKDKIDS